MVSDRRQEAGRPWLHRDEIDPQRKVRHRGPVGQGVDEPERPGSPPQRAPFCVVERLFRQPEVPAAAAADLHEHQLRGRRRVDGHEIHLDSPEPDLAAEHTPAHGKQVLRDKRLCAISRQLLGRPHPVSVGMAAYEPLTGAGWPGLRVMR